MRKHKPQAPNPKHQISNKPQIRKEAKYRNQRARAPTFSHAQRVHQTGPPSEKQNVLWATSSTKPQAPNLKQTQNPKRSQAPEKHRPEPDTFWVLCRRGALWWAGARSASWSHPTCETKGAKLPALAARAAVVCERPSEDGSADGQQHQRRATVAGLLPRGHLGRGGYGVQNHRK